MPRLGRLVSAALVVSLWSPVAYGQPVVPDGFEDVLVASVPFPTAVAATPDGRVLIASQYGQLHVHQLGALVPAPALDLAEETCAYRERGLVGVAVDPHFAANSFIYVNYIRRTTGACDDEGAHAPVGRVSRFELSWDNRVARSTEHVLVDNIPSPIGVHNLGDVKFGHDGHLYISVGDGGCDYAGDSGCFASNDAARDMHALVGKVLRITREGGIPPDNPFTGPGTVPCSRSGSTRPGLTCQEIFASGLRNPWRLAFDPNTLTTRFFINDVGQDTWEEINEGAARADYGWNSREGACENSSTDACSPEPPPDLTNPIFAYDHDDGCASITGGAFVPAGVWPAELDGAYIFADYVCGTIFKLARDDGGALRREPFLRQLGGSSATDLAFLPHEGGLALYYTTFARGGQLRRLTYTGGANRQPVARLTASTRSGPTPLTVDFDAAESSDPDGDVLTYAWDFGDGTPVAGGVAVRHTYLAAGVYEATLRVSDPSGASSTDSVRIDAGNTAPDAEILWPSADHRFAVGDLIALWARAVDQEDGELPDSALSWRVILHHHDHTHGFLPSTIGNGITFRAADPENLEAAGTSYLEILLTVTDSHGATTTVTQPLRPRTTTVQFLSEPPGATLRLDQLPVRTPIAFTAWVNQAIVLEAPAQIGPGGTALTLSSWSDGGAATHTINAPATGGTYTAAFHANAASPQRTATASTIENGFYAASNAIDGDPGTRWSSAFADPQWIAVDLGAVMDITRVALHWETAHARAYAIQVSSDGTSWATVHATTAGDGGTDDITGLAARGRYVRMHGTARATEWGYSLWEFHIAAAAVPADGPASGAYGGTPAALPGTIQAENFDDGGPGLAYFDVTPGNAGGVYRSTDVDVEPTYDAGGGYNVGWMAVGEWLQYTVHVSTPGTYTIEARVAAARQGGTFHIEVNGVDVTGPMTIPGTGDWQNWTTISRTDVALGAGQQVWRLVVDSMPEGGVVGNLNYLRVVASSGSTPPPGGSTPFTDTPAWLPGTFEAENFDNGGPNVAYFDMSSGNAGGEYRATDVDIERTSDSGGGYNVGWVAAGEWLTYTVTIVAAGTYDIEARVASPGAGGTFRIEVNGVDRTGPITVPDTGGWQAWTTVRTTGVSLGAGPQVWRVVMLTDGTSGAVGNFNWVRVVDPAANQP